MKFISRLAALVKMAKWQLVMIPTVSITLLMVASGTVWNHAFAINYSQKIVDKARELAWPYGTSSNTFENQPTDAFVQATGRVNSELNNTDCLSFVKTVIIDSGADTGFPSDNSLQESDLVDYMSSSDKWEQISTTNESDLRPGDILVSADTSGQGRNHIFINLGDGKVAGANLNSWYGRIGDLANEWGLGLGGTPFYYSGNQYKVFRNNGNTNSSSRNNSTSSNGSLGLGNNKSNISASELEAFAQNDILFYDPSDCVDPNATGVCGNTSEEKIWTILRQTFDPIHAAAIFGSIANEGGFQPVKWEYGNVVNLSTCDFAAGVTWNDLYAGAYDGRYGVGSFAITSGLSTYLHYINDNAPDLLKYFQDPSNTCLATGDDLAKKIGVSDTDRLIDFEVNYFLTEWLDEGRFNKFQNITNLNDAAVYWAHDVEACAACGYDAGDSELTVRAREAQKFYDEYKDYTCEVSSAGACSTLSELRTKMWTEASQEDREHFMYIVSQEDYTIAGVEGYMNQVIAKYGNDGTLHDWIYGQCPAFTEGGFCAGDHTITNEDQDMINEALSGSNNIRFAVGNATGGSSEVGAGKIVCVWDGTKCRDDVDYNAEGGMGMCSVYSPSPDFGECWGLEGAEEWAESMKEKCGSAPNTANTASAVSPSAPTNDAPSGNDITWIGDSYSILARGMIDATFPGVDYGGPIDGNVNYGLGDGTTYIASGKCVDQEGIDDNVSSNPSGLNILEKIKNEGKLRPYLVFALGDNKGWTQAMMDKFLRLVGNDTKVILVTSETYNSKHDISDESLRGVTGGNYNSSNAILKKAAEEYSNIYLADWAAVYKDEYYPAFYTDGDDGGHPSVGYGFQVWTQAIKHALASAAGGGSSANSTTSTISSSAGSSDASTPKEITGSDITWIGDSYSVGAQEIIEKEFSGISFGGTVNTSQSTIQDCKNVSSEGCLLGGNSTNPSGFDILRKIIQTGDLKPYLVFALGTNDGWDNNKATEFNSIMSEHSDIEVVLVTSKIPGNDFADSNAVLKKMVDENANYHLADWTIVYKDSFFSSDNEHPYDDGGFEEWVKVIKEALGTVAGGGNGCTTYDGEYPEYMQGDEPWGSMPYGSGCTYASCACGAASIAMMATVITGQDIFPTDITDYLATKFEVPYYNKWDFGELDTEVGKHYGFEVKVDYASSNEEAETKFRQYLNDGYMLHFVGSGCYPGFQLGGSCSEGHYIGIYKMIGNDRVMQANSAWGGNQESSLDDVVKAMGGGMFTAVRGSNSGKNTCNGVCNVTDNGAASIGDSGLTVEQAQKIADYYNSNKVTAGNFIGGDIPSTCDKMNCVSFSLWFVSAFTDAVDHGGTFSGLVGDGSYIADTGLPGIGWKTGNEIKPFSVFGGAGSSAWSHTGVVVGKKSDDEIITIEAAYADDNAGNCIGHDARVEIKSKEYFAEGVGILAYSDDHLTPGKGHLGNKSLNEVLKR